MQNVPEAQIDRATDTVSVTTASMETVHALAQ